MFWLGFERIGNHHASTATAIHVLVPSRKFRFTLLGELGHRYKKK